MITNKPMKRSGNIKFIAVARIQLPTVRDVVASFSPAIDDEALMSEQYQAVVRDVLNAEDFSKKVEVGARYRLVADRNAFNFTIDEQNRVFIIITDIDFSERIVFQMLHRFIIAFKKDFGEQSLTCRAGALDGKAKNLFQSLVAEYDDPTKVDKISDIIGKVDKVTQTVIKTIHLEIENLQKAREIEENSNQLREGASKFKSQATTLHHRTLWAKWRTNLFLLVFLILIIIVLIVAFAGPASSTETTTNPPATLAPSSV
jgi:hypothetical protein